MRITLLAISLSFFVCAASIAQGEDWARAMFSETSHDFGVVARGAKVEYKFTIENIYEEEAHIVSLRSSCGCTTPKIDKKYLKTWEKAELTTAIDTRSFLGRKDATITVVFDLPFSAEVQIRVHAYIRSDVVVQPGVVQFGMVNQGTAMKQKVAVNYAGRNDWQILRVESQNPYLTGQVTETSRNGGLVNYDLIVIIKADVPAGYIKDQIVLITNDTEQRTARVPVSVEGVVSPALTVRPSPLFMGVIEAGKTVTKPLVVQGKTPFRITTVQCSDLHFQCNPSEESKAVQILPVTFDAKDATGRITSKILIETDYPQAKTLEVEANAQVTPSAK